jgi:hypothetical protein
MASSSRSSAAGAEVRAPRCPRGGVRHRLGSLLLCADMIFGEDRRRLNGRNQLPKLILGVKFADGPEVVRPQAQAAAA